MELNQTIPSLRTEKGYTQERLAEMLGVTCQAVSKWECGNAYPDITLLPKLAEIFGVSVDYLLGYDLRSQKSISEITAQANELRKNLKFDEAEELLRRTLARYPNDLKLKFELAHHRFVNAGHSRRKEERDRLLSEAEDGFLYVAEHDTDKVRCDWSLNFLVAIRMIYNDYGKAAEYNDRLLCSGGIYPRVRAAVIGMNASPGEAALKGAEGVIYGLIRGMTMLVPWITGYYLESGDFDRAISENIRAAKVYEEFTDAGWIYEPLSECYEMIALAYARKKEYDCCLDWLEKSTDCALLSDAKGGDAAGNPGDVPGEIMIGEVRSSRRSLYDALTSSEREEYASVRETERYREILRKLQTD